MTMRFDDLAALEPAFLARLDPAEYGWDAEDLALALAAATPDLAAYILDNLAPESSGAVRSELDAQPDPDPLSALRAQQRIISALFWELIYRRHPDAYDAFAEIQAFPFPDLFPATLLSGARVLDVGCGTGALTRWVARHAKEATGVDPVAPMLAVARRRSRNGASFRLGRFSDLPFPADSFEVVVSNMAFQPFEDSGGISGLNEMRRVLAPGGEIQLSAGSRAADEMLRAEGFDVTFFPGALGWHETRVVMNEAHRAIVAELCRRGGQGFTRFEQADEIAGLFTTASWSAARTLDSLNALWDGERPTAELFQGDNLFQPLGIPIYRWRSPS